MKSLIIRLLYYVAWLFIGYTGIIVCNLCLMMHPMGGHKGSTIRIILFLVFFFFLAPHYVFGLTYLKKWVFKLTIPLVTALLSGGIIWLVASFFNFDSLILFIFTFALPPILLWEIAYQIGGEGEG